MLKQGEEYWQEEFKMLEEKDYRPNHKAMLKIFQIFITMPKENINNCPNLRAYLVGLINYYESNSNKMTKETNKKIRATPNANPCSR